MSVPAYVPGAWTAVACPGFVALLDPSVPAATVRSVWERGAEGVLGALALLARDGFEGLPAFALVAVRGQRVHIVQRGAVDVVVSSAVGSRTLTADGVTTWTEQVLEPATAIELRVATDEPSAAADAPAAWPLGDGAVGASSVSVALVPSGAEGDAAVETSTVPVVEAPAEAAAASGDDAAGEAVADEAASVADEAASKDDAAPASEPSTPPQEEPADEPADEPAPALVPLDAGPAARIITAPPTAPTPTASEPAAPAVAAAAPVASSPVGTAPVATAPVTNTPITTSPITTSPITTSTGTSPTSLPALVAVGAASADDHDGLTILSTDLAAIRERLPSWAADWTGADAVPGPFVAPASSEAVPQLVLSTGLVVPLDRAVLLGRAPQVTRVANRELPHLVTVPSPQQDISRTHAEVRVEGGKVLVTDLASTNGVHLTRKGEGARRLHPGEATVVEPGHVVDLGDGVTFTVERGS